jgi:hypothetical protein
MIVLFLILYFVGLAITFYLGYQLSSRKWRVEYENLESSRNRLRRGLRQLCIILGLDVDGDSFTALSKVVARSYDFYINCERDEIALIVGDKGKNE